MYTKSKTDIELEELINKQEKELRNTFLNNYKTQQATLDLFKKAMEHCDLNNFNENRVIWNFASYINIVSYDLKLIGESLFLNKDEWSKRFFARQSALLIYEAIEDILELSGKEFRSILNNFSSSAQLNEKLKELTKAVNTYKKEHIDQLKVIRHNCAAHRDQDCIEQLKIITAINWSDSVGYLTKFDKILMAYGAFMHSVINTSLDESQELQNVKK
jgi:hypothetical protein